MTTAPRPQQARHFRSAAAAAGYAVVAGYTGQMKKKLPDAVKELGPVHKLLWIYIDAHPGRYSVRDIKAALGISVQRVLPELVAAGLLIEDEPPAGKTGGVYRAAQPPKDAQ